MLHNCVEGLYLLNNGWYQNGKKRYYFSYHRNSCKEDKILHQNHDFFTFKVPLIKLSWLNKFKAWQNMATFSRKRVQNLENDFTFHDYLPQFFFKTETSWTTKMVLHTLKTRNVNVCIHLRLTFPDIKYLYEVSKVSHIWSSTMSC